MSPKGMSARPRQRRRSTSYDTPATRRAICSDRAYRPKRIVGLAPLARTFAADRLVHCGGPKKPGKRSANMSDHRVGLPRAWAAVAGMSRLCDGRRIMMGRGQAQSGRGAVSSTGRAQDQRRFGAHGGNTDRRHGRQRHHHHGIRDGMSGRACSYWALCRRQGKPNAGCRSWFAAHAAMLKVRPARVTPIFSS